MYLKKESCISESIPNAETLKVFDDSDKGINLKRFSSLKELYKDLGIDD